MELGGTTAVTHKSPRVQRRVGVSRSASREESSFITPSTKANIGSGFITTGIGAALLAGSILMFKTEAGSSDNWWGGILSGAKWLSIPAGAGLAIAGIVRCFGFGGGEETKETGEKSLAELAEEGTPEFWALHSALSDLGESWTSRGMNRGVRQALEGVNNVEALVNQNQPKLIEAVRKNPLKTIIKLLKSDIDPHILVLGIKALEGYPALREPSNNNRRWLGLRASLREAVCGQLQALQSHSNTIVRDTAREILLKISTP